MFCSATEKATVVEYKNDTKKTSYFCLKNWNFKCYQSSDYKIPVNIEKVSFTKLLISRKLNSSLIIYAYYIDSNDF